MNNRTAYSLILALSVHTTLASANPASSSAYHTDAQSSYVEDETSRGIAQVNMITCIMSALRADATVNQGAYNALIDESKCDPSSRSASGDALAQGASYANATVNSTRASNNDPMLASIWIEDDNEDFSATIFVRLSASEGASAANPYGIFRVDYCGRGEGFPDCVMNGFLESAADGIQYYEIEQGDSVSSKALTLNANGTTAGSGRLQMDNENGQDAFDFAYDPELFRRSDGTSDQCFSRDAADPDTGFSVWRYGLYDAVSGARVARNSGFPIQFTDQGVTYHGYLGYHGLHLPPQAMNALASGSTVQKVDYSAGQATSSDYTVVRSAGKLVKYTRHARTLASIDKIKFTTFVGHDGTSLFAGAQQNTQYVLHWDDAAGTFKVSAQQTCDGNGCHTSALAGGEKDVSLAFWEHKGGVQGWSQSLGGEVFVSLNGATGSVDSSAIEVVYRTQDLVYPSQLPAQLYCVRDCPTASSMSEYFSNGSASSSPYVAASYNNWSPTLAGDVITYSGDANSVVLRDAADQPLTFTDAEAMSGHPTYRYGIRSGRLFTTLADAECAPGSGTYCEHKASQIEVYYQWETGPQTHNHFAAVKDESGTFVQFDAPLNVTFDVPNTSAYGEYAGQSLVLQYGSFGDLWGIPGHCVSRSTNEVVDCSDHNSRYVAAFMIPFDSLVGRVNDGETSYLVKWLEREIRFARKDPAVCSAAGLQLPVGIALPTSAELKDPSDANSDVYVGARPSVTSAPRVIHGEVKY